MKTKTFNVWKLAQMTPTDIEVALAEGGIDPRKPYWTRKEQDTNEIVYVQE